MLSIELWELLYFFQFWSINFFKTKDEKRICHVKFFSLSIFWKMQVITGESTTLILQITESHYSMSSQVFLLFSQHQMKWIRETLCMPLNNAGRNWAFPSQWRNIFITITQINWIWQWLYCTVQSIQNNKWLTETSHSHRMYRAQAYSKCYAIRFIV